ncbi:MAG: hypothetical protein QM660_10850 [Dysgonomonas sp.]
MEKEKLSTELKTLAGQTSHSQQTWDSYIDNVVIPFAPTEEDKLPEYLKRHAEYLKTQNGQYGKDIADLTNTQVATKVEEFKKNYKPDSTTTQQQSAQVVEPKKDEVPEWARALIGKVDKFEQDKANEAKAAHRNSLIADAKKKATDLGATDETVLGFVLPLVNTTDTDTVDTLSATIKSKYDEAYTKLKGGGYNPASGSGSPNHKANTAALNAFKEQMIKEGKLPSKNTN